MTWKFKIGITILSKPWETPAALDSANTEAIVQSVTLTVGGDQWIGKAQMSSLKTVALLSDAHLNTRHVLATARLVHGL